MNGLLKNKVVLITGGSSGMGKEIARRFCKEEARVVISSRNEQKLEDARKEISGDCTSFAADAGDEKDVGALLDFISDSYHRLDIVIHAPGTTVKKTVVRLSSDEWDQVLNTNLKSLFLLAKYCYPLLIKKEGQQRDFKKFISFASVGSSLGIPESGAYCASKGGLLQLIKVLAVEWAEKKINVNAILPGYILTPLSESVLKRGATREKVLSRIPMDRFGRVEDAANMALFLSSQESNYITGTPIRIDGGLLSTAYTLDRK